MDGVGRRLREERHLRGWSQRDLARETGVNPDTISGIETEQHEPRPSTLRKLAEGLGLEVRDFFAEPTVPLGDAPATGPSLLDQARDAARRDEEKVSRAVARTFASEGVTQITTGYAEDEFRTELRKLGVPDELFEEFIWPLVVKAVRADQLEQELIQLREEREREAAQRR